MNSYIQILKKIGINIPEFFEKIKNIELREKHPREEPEKLEKGKQLRRPKTPEEK